jgi:intracellular septation protein A
MLSTVVGLAPWILYWVLESNNTHEEAAVAGLVASVAVFGWGLTHSRNVKILEVGSVLWFAVLTIAGFTADEGFFTDWSYVLSNAALAAIVLVSILAGRPFARQYAHDTVPEEYWESPIFLQSTLVISWAWFAAFVLMTASSALTRQYPSDEMWFNWVIPIGALVAAFKFTQWYPDYLKQQQPQAAIPGT